MSDDLTPLEEFVDDSAPDEVEKAKTMGWKEPKEWKGNPPKNGFVKAKEYLERAETVIPIMRAENKKLKDELNEARADLKSFKEETNKTVAKMAQMSKVALDRQRTQLEDKYSAAIEAATEVGDKEQVRKLRQAEREDLKKFDEASEIKEEKAEDAKKDVNGALPKDVQDTIGAWIADNTWYTTDAEMQALANAHHGRLLKDKPGLSLAENLEETRKYVAKRFSEKFAAAEEDEPEEEEKPRASRVEGGSRSSGGASRTKYSQLPADAKSQCDKFIKEDGLFLEKGETAEKDLAKARERYAAQYLES
ncbi:hypothetical protein [Bradyrhizobium sp. 930_D9_N1_4]|uniref:hypothetical protein n=1 Tax=Bradyrhizobium sp. 930_D9_N1_4 TaxID=3240374 RepID=UPI003F8CF0F1